MRFSWKNFKAGKIEVIVKTKEEYNEFMQRCEKKGITWLNGNAPTYHKYFKGRPLLITCGGFGALTKTEVSNYRRTPQINYSEFALQAPADVPDRAPTLEELAAILAVDMQKVKEAFTATRAAICDAMAQFRKAYNDRLQAIKEEQSHNE